MRIKKGFVMQEIGGQHVAVATGEAAKGFNGIVKLNATGARVWRGIEEGLTPEEIAMRLVDEFAVDEVQAKSDVNALCVQLVLAGIFEE